MQSSWANLTELLTSVWPFICTREPGGYNFLLISLRFNVNHLNRKLSYKLCISFLMGCRLMMCCYSHGITKFKVAVSFCSLSCTSDGFNALQAPSWKSRNKRFISRIRQVPSTRQWTIASSAGLNIIISIVFAVQRSQLRHPLTRKESKIFAYMKKV